MCEHLAVADKRFGCENGLEQKYSGVIGIVGGVVDLVAGLALLQAPEMMGTNPPHDVF